jgi:hypothetical protein
MTDWFQKGEFVPHPFSDGKPSKKRKPEAIPSPETDCTVIELTPLNAADLLEEARKRDEAAGTSEHEDALRAQLIKQMMNRSPSRIAERAIRSAGTKKQLPPRVRKMSTPRLPLTERTDEDVVFAYNEVKEKIVQAEELHSRLERSLEVIASELRRRGIWGEP